jgi:hypothetical protein
MQCDVSEQREGAVQLRGRRVQLNRRRIPPAVREDVNAEERLLIGDLQRVARGRPFLEQ